MSAFRIVPVGKRGKQAWGIERITPGTRSGVMQIFRQREEAEEAVQALIAIEFMQNGRRDPKEVATRL
jgi:hypothetical protein